MSLAVDTTFDVYSDTPINKDPDSHSSTLRLYHQALWSKSLPDGSTFDLAANDPTSYLKHHSRLGNFSLSSDSIGHTYKYVKAMSHIIQDMPEWEVNQFFSICSTIGAYIVFPSRRIDGKPTINGARGLHHKIRDRFDLTLECIRRHYGGQVSPLSETLARYADFFALFGNFEGYADYFLLKDLVSKDGTSVSFFIPFRDFDGSPLPGNVYEYRSYKDSLVSFVIARNDRMARMAV